MHDIMTVYKSMGMAGLSRDAGTVATVYVYIKNPGLYVCVCTAVASQAREPGDEANCT